MTKPKYDEKTMSKETIEKLKKRDEKTVKAYECKTCGRLHRTEKERDDCNCGILLNCRFVAMVKDGCRDESVFVGEVKAVTTHASFGGKCDDEPKSSVGWLTIDGVKIFDGRVYILDDYTIYFKFEDGKPVIFEPINGPPTYVMQFYPRGGKNEE